MGFAFVDPGVLSDGIVALRLARYTEEVDAARSHVPYYEFDIVDASDGLKAGGIVLRVGYNAHVTECAGHIGYGVDTSYRGRGYAARATRLVTRFAFERLGMKSLVITTSPSNMASQKSAEAAGYHFAGESHVPESDEMYSEGERVMRRYVAERKGWLTGNV